MEERFNCISCTFDRLDYQLLIREMSTRSSPENTLFEEERRPDPREGVILKFGAKLSFSMTFQLHDSSRPFLVKMITRMQKESPGCITRQIIHFTSHKTKVSYFNELGSLKEGECDKWVRFLAEPLFPSHILECVCVCVFFLRKMQTVIQHQPICVRNIYLFN